MPERNDYFYPRPPRGGRRRRRYLDIPDDRFLSTPSARRATLRAFTARHIGGISIHALREEGDPSIQYPPVSFHVFLSTPSARRATSPVTRTISGLSYFYPRPPRGGRRFHLRQNKCRYTFLSTPSARRATSVIGVSPFSFDFYPRPPRGGRRWSLRRCRRMTENFYPRPPRGGRLVVLSQYQIAAKFLSTPSARRATTSAVPAFLLYFYPRPPRGGRPGF